MLHFYAPALEARSAVEFSLALYDASQADPLDVRMHRVRAATSTALHGRSRDAIRAADQAALAEYVFLYYLIGRVNETATKEWPGWCLRALAAAMQSPHMGAMWLPVPSSPTDPHFKERLR